MDGTSFDNIERLISSKHFEGEKLDALRSSLGYSTGYLSADQVVQLLQQFPFDDGRTKCVEMCAPRLYGITCYQAASILRIFSFDKSKPRALELIACHITDNNLEALDSAFDFQREKKRAREILVNRARPVSPGPQTGFPPQLGNYPTGPAQSGQYPTPAPYPGIPPYSGRNPYPAPGPYEAPPGTYPFPAHEGGAQYPAGNVPPPDVSPDTQPGTLFSSFKGFPRPGFPF
ncbi:proline and serine-rich protein 1-like [Acropora muricata]|uniref:proline and serine-rich protein 1-like n=1 Tax=Acropora muricata TaxID=159855 RepID=UPI0034E3E8CE